MTEVIKQYAELSGIDEAECRFLVGGKPLKTDKPRAAAPRAAPPRAPPPPPCPAPAPSERRAAVDPVPPPRRLDEQVALTNRDQPPVVDDDDGFDCSPGRRPRGARAGGGARGAAGASTASFVAGSCSCMPNMN